MNYFIHWCTYRSRNKSSFVLGYSPLILLKVVDFPLITSEKLDKFKSHLVPDVMGCKQFKSQRIKRLGCRGNDVFQNKKSLQLFSRRDR